MVGKSRLDYVTINTSFTPLPKYGHLSQKTADYVAAEPSLHAATEKLMRLPNWPAFREMAGDSDAVIPPNGPDRARDIVTELLYFKARDGYEIELKVYRSPNVVPDATLMYRMHGGGMNTSLLVLVFRYTDNDKNRLVRGTTRGGWCRARLRGCESQPCRRQCGLPEVCSTHYIP